MTENEKLEGHIILYKFLLILTIVGILLSLIFKSVEGMVSFIILMIFAVFFMGFIIWVVYMDLKDKKEEVKGNE